MIEKAVWAAPESDVSARLKMEILPYFEKGIAGTFPGKDQVAIAYRIFEVKNTKAALILLPGRGEPIIKYAEVVYDLRDLGFSIYILEHRGQGESGLVEGVKFQFVQSYDDYVQDLDTFVRTVVMNKLHSKLFLMGHSMGGAIGTLYAAKYPRVLNGLVLSAPMFDINTQPYSKRTAYLLGQFMCSIGMSKWAAGRDLAQVTSSEARSEMSVQVADQYSKIEWRKISYRWVLASLQALEAIKSSSRDLTLPIILLQAQKDLHVPAEGQNQFCKNAINCEKVLIPNSFHEPLMETDSIRELSLNIIREFLTRHQASTH